MVPPMNDTEATLVHVTTLDGKTVKTTWANTRKEAKRAEALFRYHGADLTRVFHGKGMFGGLGAKYRIVGYWK